MPNFSRWWSDRPAVLSATAVPSLYVAFTMDEDLLSASPLPTKMAGGTAGRQGFPSYDAPASSVGREWECRGHRNVRGRRGTGKAAASEGFDRFRVMPHRQKVVGHRAAHSRIAGESSKSSAGRVRTVRQIGAHASADATSAHDLVHAASRFTARRRRNVRH